MIKDIELRAFKCFVDETISLNHLTVLTGLNSSGKSSVIQAVRMLSRIDSGKKGILPGYGDLRELANDSCAPARLLIKISTDDGIEYSLNSEYSKFDDRFPKLIYVAADRLGPQVNVASYSMDSDMNETGENVFTCIDEHAEVHMPACVIPEGAETDQFKFVLREWIKMISPSVKFDYRISHMSDSSYSTFNGHRAKNVGFGLSYTLPCIVALLLGTITKDSLVIIENPEAHLHAKAQTDMADLIGKCVQAGAQVIIETHSDHLYTGLRIFAKEHSGFNQMINTYWLEMVDGHTVPKMIELAENGRYLNVDLPVHFMDQFEYNNRRLLI